MKKKFLVRTYGCQMNVYDSTKISAIFLANDMEEAKCQEEADVIVLNTCHIREKATEKIYAELGRIALVKKFSAIVIVSGCVAQYEGERIMKRAPIVNIVVGSHAYYKIMSLIEKVERGTRHVSDLSFDAKSKFDTIVNFDHLSSISSFLSVQEGCDKFCHFCVVPYTRGRQYSRSVKEILIEAEKLVDSGVKEITLIGQNFSSYNGIYHGQSRWNAGKLISEVAKISGLERIRYTTSHPIDMDESGLYEMHALEPKLMPFVHLPAQSGSTKVLRAMNRKHDIDFYYRVIEKFMNNCPNITFSSDFIVGYPEETEEDFNETLDLVDRVGYVQAFSFKYSPRPNTPAAKMINQISENIKNQRLKKLQELICKKQLQFNKSKVGEEMEILFVKNGKKEGQLIGKSPYMQSVFVEIPLEFQQKIMNNIVKVKITKGFQNSLEGELLHSFAY